MVRWLANVAIAATLIGGLLPAGGAAAEARKDPPKDPFDGRLKISGNVGLEGRLFTQSPRFASQKRATVSLDGEVEFVYSFESGDRFTFKPFGRLDSADERRSHWDIREAAFLFRLPWDLELRAGVSKVFWGVAESNHLIDIINQTDSVEGPDGEDKLGQPMLMLTLAKDWGTIDLFVLPWFRERTFPGRSGRLRPLLYIDTRMSLPDDLLFYGDKLSMANSLEARVPILDRELVDFIEGLPPSLKLRGMNGKYVHKMAAKRWLPDAIINRRKKGFATPIDTWFQSELDGFVRQTVLASGSACRELFNPAFIEQILSEHRDRKRDHRRRIFALLSFELWYRRFIQSPVAVS